MKFSFYTSITLFYIWSTNALYIKEFKPDYKQALKYSLLFYEAQRSGQLPATNRIKWRGDSALNDRGNNGEDLTGGYYDGTDYVKFGFTMAFTSTILAWSAISYKDAYRETGQYDEVLEAIKWATDYFLKCHTGRNELYGKVGDFSTDHLFWGRPEEMTMNRPAYKINETHPGSDLAGEVSAALASASIVFENIDKSYSNQLLKHAIELYNFGKNFTGLFQEVICGAKDYYESEFYTDELAWAAIWLYKATRQSEYLEDAVNYYEEFLIKNNTKTFFYNDKTVGISILLTPEIEDVKYRNFVEHFCNFIIHEQSRTPKGLIYWDKYGTLSHAANAAFICLEAATLNISASEYVNFAKEQIDYILGSTGRSYVVGYGENYPTKIYHVASSCPDVPKPCNWNQLNSTEPNPQILYGALVSGPDENDHFVNTREEYVYTEVSLDYNAGYQASLVGLIHYNNIV